MLSDIPCKLWKVALFAENTATLCCLGDFAIEMRRVAFCPESAKVDVSSVFGTSRSPCNENVHFIEVTQIVSAGSKHALQIQFDLNHVLKVSLLTQGNMFRAVLAVRQ